MATAPGAPTLFAYSTSHRIDEVGPGLLRKDLRPEALIGDARDTKLPLLHDPRREPAVYRQLLGPAGIGPRCLASGDDWLLLERVDAAVLWQVGETSTWKAVAAYVAAMHRRLAALPRDDLPLVRYDGALAAIWRERAATAGVPVAVLAAHERAAERLDRLPATLIHGELYPSNVLVRPAAADDVDATSGVRVWPIDWEVAGCGPAVLDVAALTAGWPDGPHRAAMERAYFEAAGRPKGEAVPWRTDLRAARLLVCVQWLGWAESWTAPAAHRHDWLAEACRLAGAP
jgi:hypothetical protein